MQLIEASGISHKLRKSLGNKRNEITPEDRERITRIYAEFEENDLSKIFDNHEFIYREYTVMQPLQRSYAITDERIDNLIQGSALSSLYDEAKARAIQESWTSERSSPRPSRRTMTSMSKARHSMKPSSGLFARTLTTRSGCLPKRSVRILPRCFVE